MAAYRIVTEYKSSAAGCYGWNSRVHTFEDLSEARAMLGQMFPAGVRERVLQRSTGKTGAGGWKTLASRKRHQEIRERSAQ